MALPFKYFKHIHVDVHSPWFGISYREDKLPELLCLHVIHAHTDQDIGYGPPIDMPSSIKEDIHDHPLAPPVTSPDGFVDESADVSKFGSNIIMSRKSDQVREVSLSTLKMSLT